MMCEVAGWRPEWTIHYVTIRSQRNYSYRHIINLQVFISHAKSLAMQLTNSPLHKHSCIQIKNCKF